MRKTFKELLSAGYSYGGYMLMGSEYSFSVTSDKIDSQIVSAVKELEGITVKEIKEIIPSFSSMGMFGEYIISGQLGSVTVTFEVDGIGDYVIEGEGLSFEDNEDINHLTISNVEGSNIQFDVKLDDSAMEIMKREDFSGRKSAGLLGSCVVEECKATFKKEKIADNECFVAEGQRQTLSALLCYRK